MGIKNMVANLTGLFRSATADVLMKLDNIEKLLERVAVNQESALGVIDQLLGEGYRGSGPRDV